MKLLFKFLLMGLGIALYVLVTHKLYDVDCVSYIMGVGGLFIGVFIDRLFDIIDLEITYRRLTTKNKRF